MFLTRFNREEGIYEVGISDYNNICIRTEPEELINDITGVVPNPASDEEPFVTFTDYTMDENQMVIYACTDEERTQIEKSRQYSWEFNDALTIGKKIKEWLVDYMTSGPVIAMVLEGNNAIKNVLLDMMF